MQYSNCGNYPKLFKEFQKKIDAAFDRDVQ